MKQRKVYLFDAIFIEEKFHKNHDCFSILDLHGGGFSSDVFEHKHVSSGAKIATVTLSLHVIKYVDKQIAVKIMLTQNFPLTNCYIKWKKNPKHEWTL